MRIALRPRSRSSRGEFPPSMANLLGNFMADSTYEQAKRSLTSSSMSLVAKVSDIASAKDWALEGRLNGNANVLARKMKPANGPCFCVPSLCMACSVAALQWIIACGEFLVHSHPSAPNRV